MYPQPMMMPQPMMVPQPVMMQPVMMPQPVYYPPPPPPPPVYYPPPPPPPQQQQTIIIAGGNNNNSNGSSCNVCGRETGTITRKKIGSVAIFWCLCLLFTTGWMCYIPLTRDSCKDTELVCNRCSTVKNTVAANFC